jgi:RNA polymerase-interacting CarD/CdnL/TRCF family regulator
MVKEIPVYEKGDWIVHRQYGVGQIVSIEKKRLNQKSRRFYKVKTKNSTFWLPVEKAVNSRVDPLPSRNMIKQALAALKKPPRGMSKDVKKRQKKIKEVETEGSFVAVAKLVRDLTALRSKKRLNATEQRALERLTTRLLEPWSIRMEIDVLEARQKMHQFITGESYAAPPAEAPSKLKNLRIPSGWRRNRTKVRR